MFGKLNRETINRHLRNTKDFIGRSYNRTKNFLSDLDHGVRVAYSVYNEVKPYLNKYIGEPSNKFRYGN
jgi:methanogenic corrinoid protein MtbC1